MKQAMIHFFSNARTWRFSAIVLGFLLFFGRGIFSLDPDFGWHLKMGELILKQGIPLNDPFSYTMPSFSFVDHEWLTDIVIYIIYKFSPLALYVLFGFLAIVSILIVTVRKERINIWGLYILAGLSLFHIAGVRPQVISWVFFAVLLRILLDEKLWLKWRFIIPVIIFLWTNLHGGFILGIAALVMSIVVRLFQKKLHTADLFILALSLSATLINPYGISLWPAVLSQTGDFESRLRIIEWFPGFSFLNFPFLSFFAIVSVLFFRYRKHLLKIEIAFLIFMLLLAATSVRNVPFFVMTSLAILPRLLSLFEKELMNEEQKERFVKVKNTLLVIAVFLSVYTFVNYIFNNDTSGGNYPYNAVQYFKNREIEGEIFSHYNWGGYLIWKFPEKKVFIDGRMPSWKMDNPPQGESHSAMAEYIDIFADRRPYQEIFNKYNIKYVLLPSSGEDSSKKDFVMSLLYILNIEKETESLESRLKKDSWERIYEDSIAVIYEKDLSK